MSPETNQARHDRDSVARSALALLDEVGLADLSMRRIAARLDVQPVPSTGTSPASRSCSPELADRITASIPRGSDGVLATARGIRDALFTHRDGAELVLSTYALQLGSLATRSRC